MKTKRKTRVDKRKTSRKRYVAFHEAGHAMLADWHGVDFTVTIDGEPHVKLGPTYVEIACLIMFGGPLAQAKYQKTALAVILLTDGYADMMYINEKAEDWAHLGMRDAERSRWKRGAQWCLKKRWDLVEAIAERLMAVGTMTSDDVRDIAVSMGHKLQDTCGPYD